MILKLDGYLEYVVQAWRNRYFGFLYALIKYNNRGERLFLTFAIISELPSNLSTLLYPVVGKFEHILILFLVSLFVLVNLRKSFRTAKTGSREKEKWINNNNLRKEREELKKRERITKKTFIEIELIEKRYGNIF